MESIALPHTRSQASPVAQQQTHRQAEVGVLSHSVVFDFLPNRCRFNSWAGEIP